MIDVLPNCLLDFRADNGVLGFCMKSNAPRLNPAVGSEVKCRILDIDWEQQLVDVTMRSSLITAPAATSQKLSQRDAHEHLLQQYSNKDTLGLEAFIEIVRNEYCILSLPSMGGALAVAGLVGYNGKELGFETLETGIKVYVAPFGSETESEELHFTKTKGAAGLLPFLKVRLVYDPSLAGRRPRSRSDSFHLEIAGGARRM